MCIRDRAYIADYPIFGTIANINAFALGAAMTNPRAQVYLEWSTLKDDDLGKVMERIGQKGVSIVSGRDMVIPVSYTHLISDQWQRLPT